MKKILITGCLIGTLLLSGCTAKASNTSNDGNSTTTNNRFARVSSETLSPGGPFSSKTQIDIFVDRETRVMYMQTAEHLNSGYGVGLTMMTDANGNPLLYEASQ